MEKKQPGRKKVAGAAPQEQEDDDAEANPKSGGEPHFVTIISGQQSVEPSPTGPPAKTKSRRLKLAS